MDKTSDYPYIRAWGRMLGSGQYYITEQVEQARKDDAPANATYRDHDSGKWNTTDDITAQDTRARLGLPPIEPTAPAVLRKYGVTGYVTATIRSERREMIVFPALLAAADWVTEYRLADRALLQSPGEEISFSGPVTISLRPAPSPEGTEGQHHAG